MDKTLLGVKVALLVANGFSQDDMIAAHKALIAAGANVRIVSSENGLVNGWDGKGWGHHFAVDAQLSSALAADYSILVVPGGQRSIDKLKLTAHTKRFISSFIEANKPTVIMDDALHILILTDQIKGRIISGPEDMSDLVTQADGEWSKSFTSRDGALLTGAVDAESMEMFINVMIDHCHSSVATTRAA